MHADADFLAAVAANPQDQLTRLVYADWLDERGDPRGELVRIEEEVRFEPAWSDVLWSQKPRRNELRALCDPEWLAAMRYGTDCLPLFYGRPFPDHWRDGWRLIREATERWLGVPMPDVGGHADEVAAVEKRLELTLPPSVRELVGFLKDLPSAQQWGDGTTLGDATFNLTILTDYRMLEIGGERGCPLQYGIPLAELGSDRLRVHSFGIEYPSTKAVPDIHLLSSHDFFWFFFREMFEWICLDYSQLYAGVSDWEHCQRWLIAEFPYFTPHKEGGIYEGVGRSAFLQRDAGGVGLWSQSGPGTLTLPPQLGTWEEDPDEETYLQRMESRRAIIEAFGPDDIPF